jgi:large subunit ribosomal protein L5
MASQKQVVRVNNPMRTISIEKVVLNIGVGEAGDRLKKASTVLRRITGVEPVYTKARRSIRELGVRQGEEIGCKVTLRGDLAISFLRGALAAVGGSIKRSSFDEVGNFSFGITEYIFLPGVKYDPELGIFGLDVCVRLTRKGLRVANRKIRPGKIAKNHLISSEEGALFMQEKFGVKVV